MSSNLLTPIFLLAIFVTVSSGDKIYLRNREGKLLAYYDREGRIQNFTLSIEYCKGFGGQLPTIHSPSDMDFLTRLSKKFDNYVWLNMKVIDNENQWLDDSPFDYQPGWPHCDTPNGCDYCKNECC